MSGEIGTRRKRVHHGTPSTYRKLRRPFFGPEFTRESEIMQLQISHVHLDSQSFCLGVNPFFLGSNRVFIEVISYPFLSPVSVNTERNGRFFVPPEGEGELKMRIGTAVCHLSGRKLPCAPDIGW